MGADPEDISVWFWSYKEMSMLRSARNYDTDSASKATAFEPNLIMDPSKTVQAEKDNCDINVIVRRFGITKQLPMSSVRPPQYGDYEAVGDFREAMNAVREARENFMAMPSGIRRKFGNDPQSFLEFCSNPENVEEMVKMGLAVQRPIADTKPALDLTPNRENDDGRSVKSGASKSTATKGRSGKDPDGE